MTMLRCRPVIVETMFGSCSFVLCYFHCFHCYHSVSTYFFYFPFRVSGLFPCSLCVIKPFRYFPQTDGLYFSNVKFKKAVQFFLSMQSREADRIHWFASIINQHINY
jgi:hypothetical protein